MSLGHSARIALALALCILCSFSVGVFAHSDRSKSGESSIFPGAGRLDPGANFRVSPNELRLGPPLETSDERPLITDFQPLHLTELQSAPQMKISAPSGRPIPFGITRFGKDSLLAGVGEWNGALRSAPAGSIEADERLRRIFSGSGGLGAAAIEDENRPRYATVDGVTTRYVHMGKEHAGNGPPILLVHGFCGSVFSWRYVVPELAKRFEVIAVDLPGFGLADKPRNFDYSLSGLADWLLAFQDHLGIEQAHWAGSSMGAAISILAALKAPSHIARLALIGPVAFPEDQLPGAWRFTWPVIGRITQWALGWYPRRWLLDNIYVNKARFTDEVLAVYGAAFDDSAARHAIRQVVRRALPPDAHERVARYSQIKNAALILGGELDERVPPGSFLKLSRTLANASLRMIAGAGHVPHEDAHELVLPELLEFFEAHRAPRE